MLRKVSIVLSVFATLGLAISGPANAKQVHKNVYVHKSVHVHKNVHVNKNVRVHTNVRGHTNYVVGRTYNGHIWYGRHRHRWHGRWYAYGIGPCWINIAGLWFWNPAACPP
jgi:hypothetical protein